MNEHHAIIEETLDTIDRTLDIMENTVAVTKNNPWVITAAGVVGLAVGAVGSYFVTKRILSVKYEAMMMDEIVAAKEFYAKVYKAEEYTTPSEAVEALIPADELDGLIEQVHATVPDEVVTAVQDYSGISTAKAKEKMNRKQARKALGMSEEESDAEGVAVDEVRVVAKNIFVDGQPLNEEEWDEEKEQAGRSVTHPFIISEDEFFDGDANYESRQWTWYEGDSTLTDEADDKIDDEEKYVGRENLKHFGKGSNNLNIVYIQNEMLKLRYEIARDEGTYTEKVLGFLEGDPDKRATRKFRQGSDDD